ncbi:hypothetical protein WDU94_008152 [Cyamophila willieti]
MTKSVKYCHYFNDKMMKYLFFSSVPLGASSCTQEETVECMANKKLCYDVTISSEDNLAIKMDDSKEKMVPIQAIFTYYCLILCIAACFGLDDSNNTQPLNETQAAHNTTKVKLETKRSYGVDTAAFRQTVWCYCRSVENTYGVRGLPCERIRQLLSGGAEEAAYQVLYTYGVPYGYATKEKLAALYLRCSQEGGWSNYPDYRYPYPPYPYQWKQYGPNPAILDWNADYGFNCDCVGCPPCSPYFGVRDKGSVGDMIDARQINVENDTE